MTAPLGSRARTAAVALVAALAAGMTGHPGAAAASSPAPCALPLDAQGEPPAGTTLIGSLMNPRGAGVGGQDPVADQTSRLGQAPAIDSFYLPLETVGSADDDGYRFLDTVATEVAGQGAALGLTLSLPHGVAAGAVTAADADALAAHLATYNAGGLVVYLRIGPEMNGDWFAWGEQPQEYIRTFRLVADAVHQLASRTYTVWSPAYASGTPWGITDGGVAYRKQFGPNDFDALDTNHDGRIDATDDPYAPYWPGSSAVDWVGLSLYDFGDRYPWGPDELPLPGFFAGALRGTFHPKTQVDTSVDFYDTYAVRRGKPMMISETGAWFTPDTAAEPGAASEYAIKTAWWDQILAALPTVPLLRAVIFFDDTEPPGEVTHAHLTAPIEWQYDRTPELAAQFVADFPPSPEFGYASGAACDPPAAGAPVPQPVPGPTTAGSATAGTARFQTVCTVSRRPARLHGRNGTRTTRTCVGRLVTVRWTIGTRCSVTVTRHGRSRTRHRTCRRVPVALITPIRTLTVHHTVSWSPVRSR